MDWMNRTHPTKYTPPPWNQKYFDPPPPPQKKDPKIPKFQIPLTLAGGARHE